MKSFVVGKLNQVLLLLLSICCLSLCLPGNSHSYFLGFGFAAFLFFTGINQIGATTRQFLFRSRIDFADFPLGLSVFALFLSFWLKLSTSIVVPGCILLGFGILNVVAYFGRPRKVEQSEQLNLFLENGILIGLLAVLLWFLPGDGLLMFPLDFDSGMLHIALPLKWIELGEVSPQKYLRGPFVGNYAHVLYYFILKVFASNVGLVKIINICGFIGFFSAMRKLSKEIPRLSFLPLLIPFFLVLNFETRQYLVSTNLDAGLFFTVVSGFAVVMVAMITGRSSDLMLGTALLGFSAGLKHFGFLISAPVLVFSYLWFFNKNKIADSAIASRLVSWIGLCVTGIFVFLFSSLPFYLHNLIAGNNILFPFLGTKENSYGWTISEIADFGKIINYWGHRKDFFGFWTLPGDFLNFPQKYIIFLQHNLLDYSYSALFVLSVISIFLSGYLFVKKNRMPMFLSLINLIQLFFWYSGSQVARYLFPSFAISLLVLFYTVSFLINFDSIRNLKRFAGLILLVSTLVLIQFSRAQEIKVPISNQERLDLVRAQYGDTFEAFEYLRSQKIRERILFVGDSSFTQHFVDLDVCGDWYGPCRWGDFFAVASVSKTIVFRSVSEMAEIMKSNKIEWMVIKWSNFYPDQRRPENWDDAIPDRNCFSIEKSYATVDIFKVNTTCFYDKK